MSLQNSGRSVPLTPVDDQVVTVFAPVARTATPAAYEGTLSGVRGLHLIIDVTAVTDTPSVVVTIKGLDPVSGKAYTLLASAAITATGTTVLKVYPGLTAAANLTANDLLPSRWQVTAVHADADPITYSASALLCP